MRKFFKITHALAIYFFVLLGVRSAISELPATILSALRPLHIDTGGCQDDGLGGI
jgi:hypothetical protein